MRSGQRHELARHVPPYMIPSAFQAIETLPLAVTGKIDRKKLPRIDFNAQSNPSAASDDTESASEPPTGELERALLDIWRDVLKMPKIGVLDDFYELGGDSLAAVRIVARARDSGIVGLTIKLLRENSSVRALCGMLPPQGASTPSAEERTQSAAEKVLAAEDAELLAAINAHLPNEVDERLERFNEFSAVRQAGESALDDVYTLTPMQVRKIVSCAWSLRCRLTASVLGLQSVGYAFFYTERADEWCVRRSVAVRTARRPRRSRVRGVVGPRCASARLAAREFYLGGAGRAFAACLAQCEVAVDVRACSAARVASLFSFACFHLLCSRFYARFSCRHVDLHKLSPALRERTLDSYLRADRQRGFELNRPPLMRFALFKVEARKHLFVWTSHHILMDGWSLPIILQDVFHGSSTSAAPKFAPFVRHARIANMPTRRRAALEFWQLALSSLPEQHDLPFAKEREPAHDEPFAQRTHRFDVAAARRVADFARVHRMTPSVIYQGAWLLLLSLYLDADDIVTGVTVAGRPPELEHVESTVGNFLNALPLRTRIGASQTIASFLTELQSTLIELAEFDDVPLADIQRVAGVAGDHALFDTLLVFEDVCTAQYGHAFGADVRNVHWFENTNFLLTLAFAVDEVRGGALNVTFDPKRMTHERCATVVEHYVRVLEFCIEHPEHLASAVAVASEQPDAIGWNQTDADFPDVALHALMEQQVRMRQSVFSCIFLLYVLRLLYCRSARKLRTRWRLLTLPTASGRTRILIGDLSASLPRFCSNRAPAASLV